MRLNTNQTDSMMNTRKEGSLQVNVGNTVVRFGISSDKMEPIRNK